MHRILEGQKYFKRGVFYQILGEQLNKRMLTILSFSLVCLALIIGGVLYWYSEQWAEQRLEDLDFTTKEHSLADFQVDATVRIQYFSDFHSYAEQEDVNPIYFDKGKHALYFLLFPTEDMVVGYIFYYK